MELRHNHSHKIILILLIVIVILSACAPVVTQTPAPREVVGDVADAAAAQSAAETFLQAWGSEEYGDMYAALSSLSRDAIDFTEFESVYRDAANNLTLESLAFQLLSAMAENDHAAVAYKVNYKTRLVGELTREVVMNLTRENNTWRVQWEPGLILPELRNGNRLELVHETPSRGRIFDSEGAPLAAYADAIALGIVPGEINPAQADLLFETMASLSAYDAESLARLVETTPSDWYLPVISLSQEAVEPHMETLRSLSGVRIDEFRSRFYVDGGVAPHVVGYRLFIPEEELDAYLRLGYRQDERIGAAGLEAAYEAELSGQRAGSLYLVGPDGQIQSLLAASEPVPGQSLYTTIDKALQMRLQASLGDLRAAVVVMEVETGRVLAMVSNPDFDPNAFDLTDIDRGVLESYFTDEDQPLFNRATQGQYPLGSVFKIVSMSAALETGLYRASSSFNCGYSLWVCDSVTLYDWTYSHGVGSSGELNLPEGLMRSCNPWFYRIGQNLFNEGMEDALSDFAFGFGLGQETGIEIPESAGNIPETVGTCVNSAQMAIGQGQILVTPLQVASFVSALANGGTLYQPALVDRIQAASGESVYEFMPHANGELPVSDGTLQSVLEGLRLVIEEPRGTGYWAMQGLEIPVSGKTGTAQTPTGNSHAWFAGFSRQNDPERPDIAVAVIVENGGEGSVMAAPVFRRAVSLYFSNYEDPAGVMPWEEEPYVLFQPTPTPTADSTSGD